MKSVIAVPVCLLFLSSPCFAGNVASDLGVALGGPAAVTDIQEGPKCHFKVTFKSDQVSVATISLTGARWRNPIDARGYVHIPGGIYCQMAGSSPFDYAAYPGQCREYVAFNIRSAAETLPQLETACPGRP